MKNNSELMTQQYKLEWIDHLHAIYMDFGRRNNIEEWIYFLRRPELSNEKESEKIAEEVLKYIVRGGNISHKIIESLENIFHFSQQREKFEKKLGYEILETYCQRMVGDREFPPYELFGEFDPELDYDNYIDMFNNTYFGFHTEKPEEYADAIKALRDTGIEHPYTALLECEYYAMCEAWQQAADALRDMEDGYYKQMTLGHLLSITGQYDEAEECLAAAVAARPHKLDGMLMQDFIVSKWHNNKQVEALQLADYFIESGYEQMVMHLKKEMLSEFTTILMEKGESVELVEEEFLIIKEYYKLHRDYETVLKLGQLSWDKDFQDGSWTVDMAEACFETGQYEQAQKIIDMVNDGRKSLNLKEQLKIREIKARLLFEKGRIADAYEMIADLLEHQDCNARQKATFAKMYMKTGRTRAAIAILSKLRMNYIENIAFSYDLAKCYAKYTGKEDSEKAFYLLRDVCSRGPGYEDAAYWFAQQAIDMERQEAAEKILEIYKSEITKYHWYYLGGQIHEMNGDFQKAQAVYTDMIKQFAEEPYPKEWLYNAYVRFFLMREETGARIGEHIEQVLEVLEKYPDADDLWMYLADFHERVEYEEEKREGCCLKALEANYFNEHARDMLCNIYVESDKNEAALKLRHEEVVFTDDMDSYVARAYLNLELGYYEQAKHDVAVYESRGGDKNETVELNAEIAMHNGDYETALACYEKMLQNKSTSQVPCYDDMAVCLCKMGRADEAADLLDTACDGSGYDLFYTMLFQIQLHNGDYKEAKKTLKRLQKGCNVSRFSEDLSYMQAQILLESGKVQRADLITEGLISGEGERLCGILNILFMDEFEDGVKLLKNQIKEDPEEIDNYSWLAFAYYLEGLHDEAEAVAQMGLEKFAKVVPNINRPLRSNKLCQYGFLKMMCGEMDDAYEALTRAAEQPTCPEFVCTECFEAHCGLGIYHACNGSSLQASQEFSRSLKERPGNTICERIMDIMI